MGRINIVIISVNIDQSVYTATYLERARAPIKKKLSRMERQTHPSLYTPSLSHTGKLFCIPETIVFQRPAVLLDR